MNNTEKLKFWDERAELSDLAGTNDFIAKEIEMKTLLSYCSRGDSILDLGCGSGTAAFYILDKLDVSITGMDFSSKMIAEAQRAAKEKGYDQETLNFCVNDIRDVKELEKSERRYDIVMTERVLINLDNWQEQKEAINGIISLLKPGGLYLMCENLKEGLDNLNRVCVSINLDEIQKPWHNRYICKNEVQEIDSAELVEFRDFSSGYYFLSRVVNAHLAKLQNSNPSYDSPINILAEKLNDFLELEKLDIGQTRLWVLKKPLQSNQGE